MSNDDRMVDQWLMGVRAGDVHAFFEELDVHLPRTGASDVAVRCFANPGGHRADDRHASCSVNLITGLWHCHGCGQRGNAYAAAMACGRSERDAARLAQRYGLYLERAASERPRMPTERQLKKWRQRLERSPLIIARLGELRGWTRGALVRHGIGWDGERLTFPIRDQKLKCVGLVRYLPGGDPKMVSLPGSARGLFPAPEVLTRRRPLFMVEGEPAVISVRSCGHQAVGVPGAAIWRIEWGRRLAGHRIFILPDCDAQGRELASRMHQTLPGSIVVDIDPTADDGTDIGDWITAASRDGGLRQIAGLLDRVAA